MISVPSSRFPGAPNITSKHELVHVVLKGKCKINYAHHKYARNANRWKVLRGKRGPRNYTLISMAQVEDKMN